MLVHHDSELRLSAHYADDRATPDHQNDQRVAQTLRLLKSFGVVHGSVKYLRFRGQIHCFIDSTNGIEKRRQAL